METTITSPLYTSQKAQPEAANESNKQVSYVADIARSVVEVGIFAALYIAGASLCYLLFLH